MSRLNGYERPPAPPSTDGSIVLRFLAQPSDVGMDGETVQAGRVMEWVDRAGYACAAAWSGAYCVTAYVGNVHFARPIAVGSIVETTARILSTGRSSMQILVTADTADPTGGEFSRAFHCLLVFVSMDENRRPQPVRPWQPRTMVELDAADRSAHRLTVRARIKTAMEAESYTDAGTTPRTQFRFLAAPADINWGGNVHGGTVMRWIDDTARTCVSSWTRSPAVAVYAGGIHFHRPIRIGHVVEVDSRIIHTGPHSVHVSTHVRSADPMTGDFAATTECMAVFTCPDGDGRAAPVDPLPLISDEDVRLDRHARDLIAMRAELDSIVD